MVHRGLYRMDAELMIRSFEASISQIYSEYLHKEARNDARVQHMVQIIFVNVLFANHVIDRINSMVETR